MHHPLKSARGFTLIELLAVMAILAILGTVGIVAYQKFQIRAQEEETTAKLTDLSMRAGQYSISMGDVPPDSFASAGTTTGNDINIGIEAFVATISAKNSKAENLSLDKIGRAHV